MLVLIRVVSIKRRRDQVKLNRKFFINHREILRKYGLINVESSPQFRREIGKSVDVIIDQFQVRSVFTGKTYCVRGIERFINLKVVSPSLHPLGKYNIP